MEIPVEILMIDERMFAGFITFKYLLSSSGKIENGFHKTTKGVHIYTIFFSRRVSSHVHVTMFMLQCSCYRRRMYPHQGHRMKCEDSYLVSLYLCGISLLCGPALIEGVVFFNGY